MQIITESAGRVTDELLSKVDVVKQESDQATERILRAYQKTLKTKEDSEQTFHEASRMRDVLRGFPSVSFGMIRL